MYTAPSLRRNAEPRRGVILVIVLLLITAFALVGLSFVLYADSEAKAAQIAREAEQGLVVHPYDLDPKAALSNFLGQLVFDVSDPTGANTDINSALRGHSLARSMFGYNDINPASNVTPFNGVGRLSNTTTPFGAGEDEFNLVNYQWFVDPTDPLRVRLLPGFHDPERPGFRSAAPLTRAAPRLNWLCGFNAPYTAADANNMFLAVVDSSGNIVQPSFHRQSVFGALDPGVNPNWTSPVGKYKTLRPRPSENPSFGFPEDLGGDVKNLLGNPGGNDSIWMNLGSPVRTAPNGRTYTTLFAPLIIDLDSRINVSAHGNILGQVTDTNNIVTPNHISNTSWGPWTVNIGQVLKDLAVGSMRQPNDPFNLEWTHLFAGTTQPPIQVGRYGNLLPMPGSKVPGNGSVGSFPTNTALGTAFTFPLLKSPYYSKFAFDEGILAGSVRTSTSPLTPMMTTANTYFPTYQGGYSVDLTTGTSPLTNHPLAYNMFGSIPAPSDDDKLFNLADMESLLRFNDSTSYSLTSSLLNLCPNVLGQQRARNLVTTRSFDIDVPGVSPWLTTRSASAGTYSLASYTSGSPSPRPLAALPGNFPSTALITGALPTTPINDFSGDGRMSFGVPSASNSSLILKLAQRLDLNRPLPDYPTPGANGLITGPTDTATFNAAQSARQVFAQDIFDRLRLITGADAVPSSGAGKDGLRWLAQLAVNIVDFIDTDDYMTPFNWNPSVQTDVVYGVELPRLQLNEVYVQYKKSPPGSTKVDVLIELYNPLNPPLGVPNYLTDGGAARLFNGADSYQIVLCTPTPTTTVSGALRANINPLGDPTSVRISTGAPPPPPGSPGATPCTTLNLGSAGVDKVAPNSYFLVGPPNVTMTPAVTLDSTQPNLSFTVPSLASEQPPAPTVVLQRLACPHMANQANVNDWVTVDYFEDACGGNSPSTLGGFQLLAQNEATNPNRASFGRINPYMGNKLPVSNVVSQAAAPAQHTFKAVNINLPSTINTPWLTHLDRYLSSPMELLHVSGVHPQELTQTFGDQGVAALGHYGHRVPWFDEDLAGTSNSHRLYRFFEMIETRSRFSGMGSAQYSATLTVPAIGVGQATLPPTIASNGALVQPAVNDVLVIVNQTTGAVMDNVRITGSPSLNVFSFVVQQAYSNTPVLLLYSGTGGRQPGKINLNGVQSADSELLMALADPPPSGSNNFSAADVTGVFGNLKSTFLMQPTLLQTPFIGNALGQYTTGDPQYSTSGVNRSLFQLVPGSVTNASILEPTNASLGGSSNHPYLRYELLNKIFNNTTSRSNLFAVWLTVGFFECDANGNNLGQEIGKSEGKSIRHRMFAIVDRTGLAVPRQIGTLSNIPTTGITVGTQLLVGTPGTNMELATVAGVTGSVTFTAALSPGHAGTDPVFIAPGNWGPQPGFDVTQPVNKEIVPYYSIIE